MSPVSERVGEPDGPIVKPYALDPNRPAGRRRRLLLSIGVTGFCFIYGAAFALFANALLPILVLPVVVLMAVALWAAPDTRSAPITVTTVLFYLFTLSIPLWPAYLAFKVGGAPSITLARLILFPFAAVFTLCVGISRPLRAAMGTVLRATPLLWVFMASLLFIEVFTLAFSDNKAFSIERFILAQIQWTAMFFFGCFVFEKPGRVEKWVICLWVAAMVVGTIGVFESRLRHILWYGHIPSFLQVPDYATLAKITPHIRFGTAIYRVQSTFDGPLDYAEFMGLTLPFIAGFLVNPYNKSTRIMAGLSLVFLIVATLLAHARSAGLAVMVLTLLYPLFLTVKYLKTNPASLWGRSMLAVYPAMGAAAFAAVLVVGRLRNKLFGGHETSASTQARVEQWALGIPKLLHNPVGHGIDTAGSVLGYVGPDGALTIDTYYLSVLLDFGIEGFIIYYGMFLYAAYLAARTAYESNGGDRETAFLVPAAISLLIFVLIKANFSEEGNHPLVFMILGMVAALAYRVKRRRLAPSLARTPPRPAATRPGRVLDIRR